MCWFTVDKELTKYNITTDNIVCNKIVKLNSGTIESPYMGFPYELDKVYSINKDLVITKFSSRYEITKGFHSYSTNVVYKYNTGWACIDAYSEKTCLCNFSFPEDVHKELGMASCIIPRGSTYYLNELGEYVSDKIKILTVFKIEEK